MTLNIKKERRFHVKRVHQFHFASFGALASKVCKPILLCQQQSPKLEMAFIDAPDDVKQKLKFGCTVVCLGVPVGTEIGVDLSINTVGQKFLGVKMLPPGLHFVYSRVSGGMGDSGPRSGFFFRCSSGQVVVRRWDAREEALCAVGEEEEQRVEAAVRRMEMDCGLAPHSMENQSNWSALSSFIDDGTLRRWSALNNSLIHFVGKVDDDCESQSEKGGGISAILKELCLRSSTLGLEGAALTKAAMDKTHALERLIGWAGSEDSLLGELQFSFITFLIGESFSGLEAWKEILRIFCSCEEAVHKHTSLMVSFVKVLRMQLKQTPEDMFMDPITSGNFLGPCVKSLLQIVEEFEVDAFV